MSMLRAEALRWCHDPLIQVSGKASGGVEQVVTSEGTNLMVFNLTTGELQHIFQVRGTRRHPCMHHGHRHRQSTYLLC